MKRTTTRDEYSHEVKLLYAGLRLGVISPARFSKRITDIWERRNGTFTPTS